MFEMTCTTDSASEGGAGDLETKAAHLSGEKRPGLLDGGLHALQLERALMCVSGCPQLCDEDGVGLVGADAHFVEQTAGRLQIRTATGQDLYEEVSLAGDRTNRADVDEFMASLWTRGLTLASARHGDAARRVLPGASARRPGYDGHPAIGTTLRIGAEVSLAVRPALILAVISAIAEGARTAIQQPRGL